MVTHAPHRARGRRPPDLPHGRHSALAASRNEPATRSPLTSPPKIVVACAIRDMPRGRRDQSHGRQIHRRSPPAIACRTGSESGETAGSATTRRAPTPTLPATPRATSGAVATPPISHSNPPWDRSVTANRYARESPVPSQPGNKRARVSNLSIRRRRKEQRDGLR